MNTPKYFRLVAVMSTIAALFVITNTTYAEEDSEETVKVVQKSVSAADIKKSIARSFKMIGQYTLEQRDKAIHEAEKVIAPLDKRINETEEKLEARWQSMSDEARAKQKKFKSTLHKQRNKVAEWYGGMRHSSTDAWGKVKEGFKRSYDELEKALDDAAAEFEE